MFIINHPKERTEEKLMSRKGEAQCTSYCSGRNEVQIEQLSPFQYAYSTYIIFRIPEHSFKNPSYFSNNFQTSQLLPTLWPRVRETLLSNLKSYYSSSSHFSQEHSSQEVTYRWVWKVTMDWQSQQHPYKRPSSAEALSCQLRSSLPPKQCTGGRKCNPRWETLVTRKVVTYLFLKMVRIQTRPIHLRLLWCFPLLTVGLVLRDCSLLWLYRR